MTTHADNLIRRAELHVLTKRLKHAKVDMERVFNDTGEPVSLAQVSRELKRAGVDVHDRLQIKLTLERLGLLKP